MNELNNMCFVDEGWIVESIIAFVVGGTIYKYCFNEFLEIFNNVEEDSKMMIALPSNICLAKLKNKNICVQNSCGFCRCFW